MDPYSSERWLLESHAAVVRKAEQRARLRPAADRSIGVNAWLAGRLRDLADRMDGEGRLEGTTQ
ncbi:MAG: hypothetical protein ACYDB4_15095 [Candidatus Dormibacteraceae bacterium]